MLQILALVELGVCWIVWMLAFLKPRELAAGQKKAVSAPASKWGIFFVGLGFALDWAYVRPDGFQQPVPSLIVSMLLGPPSVLLVWAAARRLGKHWRFEAALSQEHELVQSGPYRWVRHPIYASMFGMLLATGFAWTWRPMFCAAVVSFVIGTEIRVRAEDRLLVERFQASFEEYRSRVPAYIPFVR